MEVHCGRDAPDAQAPISFLGDLKMAVEVTFLNSAMDATGAVTTGPPCSDSFIRFREPDGWRTLCWASDPACFWLVLDAYIDVQGCPI